MPAPTCNSPGFSEAVVSVSNLDTWISFFEDVFQWKVAHRGLVGMGIHELWRLPPSAEVEDVLVRDPDALTELGAIRLVKFHGVEQQVARPNAYAWDTGGFFDLHVQVRNLHSLIADMQARGWIGYTQPQRIEVSGVVLDEVLIRGPDGMAFALIERVSPPFQVVEGYRRASPAWNAPQMVSNFTAAYQFYADGLGFKPIIETEMAPPADGENLYGLPLSVARQTKTQLAFFHPTGERGAVGSVDLLHLDGLEGRRHDTTTQPPNLGLVVIRYPVSGLQHYADAITSTGVAIKAGPVDVELTGLGATRAFAVHSPEGARLEFYEKSA